MGRVQMTKFNMGDYILELSAAFCRLTAASFASESGLLHRAGGGSQIPNSFLSSSTSCSHRSSQYTVIRLVALLPHLSAHGTYSLKSRERFV